LFGHFSIQNVRIFDVPDESVDQVRPVANVTKLLTVVSHDFSE
jgi:hypothetical protein